MKIMNCWVKKNKNVVGKVKIETPQSIWIDEFVALRSKCYAFECRDDIKNKLKSISKSYSKNNNFDEYKKCLQAEKYHEECDDYIIRSLNHEMYLQLVQKSTVSLFDDKRCSIHNIESTPWN